MWITMDYKKAIILIAIFLAGVYVGMYPSKKEKPASDQKTVKLYQDLYVACDQKYQALIHGNTARADILEIEENKKLDPKKSDWE